MPAIIFVQDAIQKTESRVMGSLVSTPRLPEAWEMISSPFLLMAQKTKPGIWFLGLDVAASIAGSVSFRGTGREEQEGVTFADARGACLANLVACHVCSP